MVKNSFSLKIMLIFLIPLTVLGYFGYYFLSLKYQALQKSELYLYVAKNIESTSRLIHTIQLERGLSAGYLVVNDPKRKKQIEKKLLKRYEVTNRRYKEFLKAIDATNPKKALLEQIVDKKNKKYETMLREHFTFLESIRKRVLNANIRFCEEIEYYSSINSALLDLMYIYLSSFNKTQGYSVDIFKLEKLKEYAGLERAFGYNFLLNAQKSSAQKNLERMKELIVQQEKYENEFLLDSPTANLLLFKNSLDNTTKRRLQEYRKALLEGDGKLPDAAAWFAVTTKRIEQLQKATLGIINNFQKQVVIMYNQERSALYIAFLILGLAVITVLFLLFYLMHLVNKEARLMEDLRIASYTFDSQEAVTITDKDAKIIRINNAFSDITGYSPQEAIGNTPKILKSGRHDEAFYKEMWEKLLNEGKWSGEIYNKRKNGEIYPEKLSITAIKDEEGNTTHYIAQFVDISEIKKAQERAVYQASHDFLTKLPNRKSMLKKLQEELERAKRHNYCDAFLFLDLDGFKKINDTYGHTIGDKVLVETARRLKSITRIDDYIARISGDEFCVMLLNLDKADQKAAQTAKTVAQKIIDAISKPMMIDGHTIIIGVSIGIKLFPDGHSDTNGIINGADTAMYRAKESGKNRYVFFNDALQERMKELSTLEQEIKQAFLNQEFVFYMQPKVEVDTNKIVGAELLVRWLHPQKGLLFPDAFLQSIKEMGRQSDLSLMALQQACEFLQKHSAIEGTLSINISSFELISKEFIQSVVRTIEHYNIDATLLEFEILENELIENFDLVLQNIGRLKEYGIEISIDDFGTGYSSVSYLRKLPVDTLKIDRYFVQNLDDKANKKLVVMLLDIAKTFGFKVVVEGVESVRQLEFIRENEADMYQGFLFSKAVEPEAFCELFQKSAKQT